MILLINIFVFLVFVAWYLGTAFFLKQLAEKIGTGDSGWAWIPILNILLVLRIAGWSLWTFFALILPVVGIFVWIAVWFSICSKVGRSRWLTLTMLYPFANTGGLAYLAGNSAKKSVLVSVLLFLGLIIPLTVGMQLQQAEERERYASLMNPPSPSPLRSIPSLRPTPRKFTLPDDVNGLIAALTDPSWDVREKAAEVLGTKKDPAAVEPLIAALKDSDHRVRQTAATALGELGDPRAIDALASAAAVLDKVGEDANSALDDNAVRALEKINDPRTVDALIGALENPGLERADGGGQGPWRQKGLTRRRAFA